MSASGQEISMVTKLMDAARSYGRMELLLDTCPGNTGGTCRGCPEAVEKVEEVTGRKYLDCQAVDRWAVASERMKKLAVEIAKSEKLPEVCGKVSG